MKKPFVILCVAAVILGVLFYQNFYSDRNWNNDPELSAQFDKYSGSFDKIAETIKAEGGSGEIMYSMDKDDNTLTSYGTNRNIVYLDDDAYINDVKNFSNYVTDCIKYSSESNQVIFFYGVGLEYVVYSENDNVTKKDILKLIDIKNNSHTIKYKLKDNWYYVRLRVR